MTPALLIASTPDIRDALAPYAPSLGVEMFTATTGSEARRLMKAFEPVLIIVDRELNGLDAFDLVREAARGGAWTAVVSSRNEAADRVQALEAGADDYFAKPIDPQEVYLRLRKLLGRRPSLPDSRSVVHVFAGVAIDLATRALVDPRGEAGPALTETEFAVFRVLADKVGEVVDRAALARAMDGAERRSKASRALDACVSRLRIKLKRAQARVEIRSLRQVGYLLRREPGAPDPGGRA